MQTQQELTTGGRVGPVDLTALTWQPAEDDELFAHPYVDVDEWHEQPVAHRYVHGGFTGTGTRFSVYLPPAGSYAGRFYQHVTPAPQSELLAQDLTTSHHKITFAVDSGACFVETNGGGEAAGDPTSGVDLTIAAYRANGAAAHLARQIARAVYGPHRVYGYLYGGSGGGYRTIGASENTTGVWDGFVPYVIGSPMAIPSVFTVRMHALRVLRDRFPEIVDAWDAGGDPGSVPFTPEEREAFEEVTRMGFPPRSWFGWRTMGMHAFSSLYPGVTAADPGYLKDFWSLDGYLGADPTASVHRDLIRFDGRVTRVTTAGTAPGIDAAVGGGVDDSFRHLATTTAGADPVVSVRVSGVPGGWGLGAELTVRPGTADARTYQVQEIDSDTVVLEPGQAARIAVGDRVSLDNSAFLAVQTYHRHQVPDASFPAWDQFRGVDGNPRPPQRDCLLGPLFTWNAAGTVPVGAPSAPMIVVASLLDREAYPWQADWYRRRVEQSQDRGVPPRIRLWYVDNALHGDDGPQEHPSRSVSYLGVLETALRQVAAWVERGVEPSASTRYEVRDSQVHLAADGPRLGVQPTVTLTVDGAERCEVAAGDEVEVRIEARAPVGTVVEVLAELTGRDRLGTELAVVPAPEVATVTRCRFDVPGTYFVTARATAQTDGDPADRHARVHNLARARVVVR